MPEFRIKDQPEIIVYARSNSRAKRLTLRHSSRDGKFWVTHPKFALKSEIQAFLDNHRDWMLRHKQKANIQMVDIGGELPFFGDMHKIVEGEKRGVHLDGDLIKVKSVNPPRALAGFLKSQAALYALEKVDFYVKSVDRNVSAIRWRDPKTRWGSCDSKGVIMLSWRLALAPKHIFDYVIAHEAAHLVEMNHSDKFWYEVEKIYPNYKEARRWLRLNGTMLQSYQFI